MTDCSVDYQLSPDDSPQLSSRTAVHNPMMAAFSVDSSSAMPIDRRSSVSVLSQPPLSASCPAQQPPPPLVQSAGCGWYNLNQDSRGVYSLSLFLLCLGLLCFLLLVAESSGGDGSTCRQLRVVDFSAVCSDPTVDTPQGYNDYDSHAADNTLLIVSLLLALGGNAVYHRWSIAFLLASAGMQGYVLSQYALDAPYCAWNQLGAVVDSCITVGSSFNSDCQSSAYEECGLAMLMDFKLVSFRNLAILLILCLLLLMQLVAIAKAIVMNRTVKALTAGRLSLPAALFRFPTFLSPDQRNSAWERCERHFFGRWFATEQQRQWMAEISECEHHEALSSLRWSWSLRVTFAATFSLFLVSGLALAIVLFAASFTQYFGGWLLDEVSPCIVTGAVIACGFVWMMMLVHRLALSVAVKHRILSYLRAERATESVQTVLECSKIRWFSLPFYTGSLFSSMLWSYVFINIVVSTFLFLFVNADTRQLLWDHSEFLCSVFVFPAALILVYRICAFRCVFGRWTWNHRVSLLEPPSRPRCYICCDSYGMCLGAWGGFMTIMLRILGAFPTAVSRLDIATSGFDFVHDQFLSLVEVEAYRLYRDWKLQQAGLNVELKDCEQDDHLAGVIPV